MLVVCACHIVKMIVFVLVNGQDILFYLKQFVLQTKGSCLHIPTVLCYLQHSYTPNNAYQKGEGFTSIL